MAYSWSTPLRGFILSRAHRPTRREPYTFAITGFISGSPKSNELVKAVDLELQRWEPEVRAYEQFSVATEERMHHLLMCASDHTASLSVILTHPQQLSPANVRDILECIGDLRGRMRNPNAPYPAMK